MSMAAGILGALMAGLFFGNLDVNSFESSFIPLPGIFVGIWMSLVLLLTVPYMIAGVGLWRLRPWARTLSTIVMTLGMLSFPFGTLLGVYGLWLLASAEADAVFSPRFGRFAGR